MSKKVPGIIKEKTTMKIDNIKNLLPMFATKKTPKIGIKYANAKTPRSNNLFNRITILSSLLNLTSLNLSEHAALASEKL